MEISGNRKRKRKRKRKPKHKNSTAKAVVPDPGAENYAEDQTLAVWIAACRKKSKTEKYSASFPREIIFNILVCLSATVLHKIMRYVCKEWNDIINDPPFIRAHLLHLSSLSPGIVLQDHAKPQWAYCLRTINTTGPKQMSKHGIPFPATILGSCNGLLLLHDKRNPEVLHVMNLLTKTKVSLPPLTGVCILDTPYAVLAFTPSSGQYKVVVIYVSLLSEKEKPVDVLGFRLRELNDDTILNVQLMVCTVAVDKTWRAIDCSSMTMNEDANISHLSQRTLMTPPISRAGFIYWYFYICSFGLTLDVDAETMYQVPGPKDYVEEGLLSYRIKMETGVGLLHVNENNICRIWEMIDPKSGTWARGRDVDAYDMYCRLQRLLYPCTIGCSDPLLSLENGELWFSSQVDEEYTLVCYNGKTGYIWSLPVRWPSHLDLPHFHINSLLSLKNNL